MPPPDDTSWSDPTTRGVWHCQQQFWAALSAKDPTLLTHVLADDFVCQSPRRPDQPRAAFIATITAMPVTVVRIAAEQVAIRCFGEIAVLTAIQLAELRLPGDMSATEQLALTNVFRHDAGEWRMVLARPVRTLLRRPGSTASLPTRPHSWPTQGEPGSLLPWCRHGAALIKMLAVQAALPSTHAHQRSLARSSPAASPPGRRRCVPPARRARRAGPASAPRAAPP